MPDTFNNIFLTTENLAFSLPLIIVCATYVYFTYIPLHIGVPILVALFALEQIRLQFKKLQDKKLTNLDEGAIKNIIGELEEDEAFDDKENSTNDSAAIQKAKHRVQLRLAMEKKAAARKGNNSSSRKGDDDDNNNNDDDVGDLSTFAKNTSSGASTKSKKK